MKKELLVSILTFITFSGLHAQTTTPNAPRLVVNVIVDQLRTDYLENFSPLYSERGFKRLFKEGCVYRQAEFNFERIDRASAIAALQTGCSPSFNGIVGERWMNISTLQSQHCVDDPAFMGNYTDEHTSATALLTSNIADELKIATASKSLVYAIAPTKEAAILSAGHKANGALWINSETGKWCGTTYYNEFPWWVSQYNDSRAIDSRIDNMVWMPTFSMARYTFLPNWNKVPFKHKFSSEKENQFKRLVTSPFVNDEINTLIEETLIKSNIGKDDITDYLAVTYYAGNYAHKTIQECAVEMQDTYVHLDYCLETLLSALDKRIGLQNVLICITSTGYTDTEAADLGMYNIPTGEFHLNRCAALLNMFLMATYGEGTYVEAYYDQQIYLDHKTIEKKKIDFGEIQAKAAAFLVQFSGVNDVYSSHRMLLGPWSPKMEKMRNSFHRQRSGDLFISVLPGWKVINDDQQKATKVVRYGHIPVPLIFMGYSIQPTIIDSPISVNRVAPTLAHAMRIRAPNGCCEPAIHLQRKTISK